MSCCFFLSVLTFSEFFEGTANLRNINLYCAHSEWEHSFKRLNGLLFISESSAEISLFQPRPTRESKIHTDRWNKRRVKGLNWETWSCPLVTLNCTRVFRISETFWQKYSRSVDYSQLSMYLSLRVTIRKKLSNWQTTFAFFFNQTSKPLISEHMTNNTLNNSHWKLFTAMFLY